MFIHWGLYAIPAGEWQGRRSLGIGEWIMNRLRIPVREYETLTKQFNPTKYNPDDWVQLAQDAGMKYIVITSKHHDGFALFKSSVSRYNVVDANLTVPNGMAADRDGSLIVCDQGSPSVPAQLRRLDPRTGATSTIVDTWHGLRFNSPNDVVVKSDGTIWFTDPAYGYLQGFRPSPQVGDFVYRFDPATGSLSVVADSFSKPNGIAFSPDENVLYVTDSGANQEAGTYYVNLPHHVIAYDVVSGRQLTNQRLLAVTTPGFPDGIKVDEAGRVYASSQAGVQVFSPDGDLLGQIDVPGAVNFTFGGADRNILFITADTAIWAATLDTRGA